MNKADCSKNFIFKSLTVDRIQFIKLLIETIITAKHVSM